MASDTQQIKKKKRGEGEERGSAPTHIARKCAVFLPDEGSTDLSRYRLLSVR